MLPLTIWLTFGVLSTFVLKLGPPDIILNEEARVYLIAGVDAFGMARKRIASGFTLDELIMRREEAEFAAFVAQYKVQMAQWVATALGKPITENATHLESYNFSGPEFTAAVRDASMKLYHDEWRSTPIRPQSNGNVSPTIFFLSVIAVLGIIIFSFTYRLRNQRSIQKTDASLPLSGESYRTTLVPLALDPSGMPHEPECIETFPASPTLGSMVNAASPPSTSSPESEASSGSSSRATIAFVAYDSSPSNIPMGDASLAPHSTFLSGVEGEIDGVSVAAIGGSPVSPTTVNLLVSVSSDLAATGKQQAVDLEIPDLNDRDSDGKDDRSEADSPPPIFPSSIAKGKRRAYDPDDDLCSQALVTSQLHKPGLLNYWPAPAQSSTSGGTRSGQGYAMFAAGLRLPNVYERCQWHSGEPIEPVRPDALRCSLWSELVVASSGGFTDRMARLVGDHAQVGQVVGCPMPRQNCTDLPCSLCTTNMENDGRDSEAGLSSG